MRDESQASAPNVSTMVRTLVGNGFVVFHVAQKLTYTIFSCHRYDEFGSQVRYEFVLSGELLGSAATNAVRKHASRQRAQLVIVSDVRQLDGDVPGLDWARFLGRCGGPIKSWLPLERTFSSRLIALGHNKRVPGLVGRPDDLFEQHVHAALQFILADQVIRYGRSRSGEALPDGGAFGRKQPMFLYDAKAYKDGYPVSRGSIRQFSDYVDDFHTRYESYCGRLHTFLVISGHFQGNEAALLTYAQEMYSKCGIPLAYIEAKELGCIAHKLSEQPALRGVLDWQGIFSRTVIRCGAVGARIRSARKDRLLRN